MDNLGRPPPVPTTVTGMGERRAVTVAAVLWCTAATVVLVGCTPEAAPTPLPLPTATGFASDEEAFAAAEATYRAYVDADNARRAGDMAADPTRYLSGPLLEAELDSAAEFAELGVRLEGDIKIESFTVSSASTTLLMATICLDVSSTRVLNERDENVTPETRENLLGQDVTMLWASNGITINESSANEAAC